MTPQTSRQSAASLPDSEPPTEQVVLLDADYQPIGTQDKATVHTTDTPLHLAFSCYILDHSGQLVLTRRALAKVAWPGVWTNSVCGHIGPGEAASDAVARRVAFELGLDTSLQAEPVCVLEDFEYRAVDDSGIVEWEFCPVYIMRLDQEVQWEPNPAEVANLVTYPVEQVLRAVAATPAVFSPWMVSQLAQEGLVQALREVSAQ